MNAIIVKTHFFYFLLYEVNNLDLRSYGQLLSLFYDTHGKNDNGAPKMHKDFVQGMHKDQIVNFPNLRYLY